MPMIAVEAALEMLIPLLANQAQSFSNVSQRVNDLKDYLESMRSFLQDAELRAEKDQGLRTWVRQVRDVAYETEDVLEELSLHLNPNPPHDRTILRPLSSGLFHLRRLRTRYGLSSRIDRIKDKIKVLLECSSIAFSLKSTHDLISSNQSQDLRLDALFIDDTSVVGIENPRSQLISLLEGGKQDLSIISVVGLGGVGKTTLVRKVFENGAVKGYFDRQAWITVSKSYTVLELLRASLKGFMSEAKEVVNERISTMNEIELINSLNNYLEDKRYLIVFDDIWNVDAWEQVKYAFPCCLCGSRIIFTTRVGDLTLSIETINHVFYLKPLSEHEAWTLFCMKAFRGEYNGVCPGEMCEISRSIVRKCGGLPLAIVVMGGLLARKEKNVLEWEKILASLFVETESNSRLESLERILLLSYNDLSYHLKCCILYTSMFPEDYHIKKMKLCRLWVSEGFVKDKPGYTREEVAEHYLNELVNRSMLQIASADYFICICQLHDVMREVLQKKSRDESFSIVMSNNTLSPMEKIHRIAIYENFDREIVFTGHLRSLLAFGSDKLETNLFNGCKLLRVVELEYVQISKFPGGLTDMIHLKYLSLRGTNISKIPYSIGNLRSLEMLDLKYTKIRSLSNGILKLKNLCQLRLNPCRPHSLKHILCPVTVKIPSAIGNLTKLEKLGVVGMQHSDNFLLEFEKLTNLKKLHIKELTEQHGTHLSSTLEKLEHLTALNLCSLDKNFLWKLQKFFP